MELPMGMMGMLRSVMEEQLKKDEEVVWDAVLNWGGGGFVKFVPCRDLMEQIALWTIKERYEAAGMRAVEFK